ncbi:MAG: EAL domain-containing protein, partial [Proteobacteria bacterium]|nr:EAL domain-containing protein [Pseudomonadota bacterium]
LTGNSIVNVFYKDDVQTALEYLHQCFAEPDTVHHWELRMVRADGLILWVRETARVVTDTQGESTALIVCEDITEIRQLTEQLSFQASHDALTGLVNRREFEHRLQRVLDTARNEQTEHALCYLDLDQFKVINDTCGHVAGDELLRQLGSLLQKEIRKRDTLARLGGDEFGVLMEHCSLKQAKRVATKLRKAIEAFRFVWEERSFAIGVSIGLVPITATSMNTIEILKQADAACYAAKDRGRNRIHVYHQDDTELAQRHGEMQWVAQINRALEEDRFCLYMQTIKPLLAHADDTGDHYELLLRMREEDKRLIPPGAFLPAAERYNLSTRLDRWVLDHAFDWLLGNPGHLERLAHCAINLSGLSLGDDEFLEHVIARFEETGIPPGKICFEVTETAAIANLSSATVFIKALKELGCQFALDDFGSGLSSFAYLKTLPVDYLKIDGMFVKNIETDRIDLAMVKSINDIGKVMNIRTIAEFVENDGILEKLKEIGVDYAQGFGIAKPQPIESMM